MDNHIQINQSEPVKIPIYLSRILNIINISDFLCKCEKYWLNSFQDSDILFYRRYVDDTFCIFRSEQDAIIFLNYISTRHPNIIFTMDKKINHIILSLAVVINNNSSDSPVTSIYRKKTGLRLIFFSFSSFSYKLG